jgi:enoyl-CoA hydratase/carnithine racemase
MAAEARAIAAQSVHPNGVEGVRAFLEKRKPNY